MQQHINRQSQRRARDRASQGRNCYRRDIDNTGVKRMDDGAAAHVNAVAAWLARQLSDRCRIVAGVAAYRSDRLIQRPQEYPPGGARIAISWAWRSL